MLQTILVYVIKRDILIELSILWFHSPRHFLRQVRRSVHHALETFLERKYFCKYLKVVYSVWKHWKRFGYKMNSLLGQRFSKCFPFVIPYF